mgnify:CR=1 FL=1
MIEIKKNIYWVGVRDWALRKFHGEELSTHRGSSYNSYLIKDKKTVLVDTAWDHFKEQYVETLEKEVGLNNIDLIVVNHSEIDHSGSLEYLLEKIPDTPIYCTKNGMDILKRHYNKDWNFNIVKTGDTINIGEYDLVFVEMQMLHWPDSMLTYVKGANLVLSNDAFGQHFAARSLFNDEVDECELYQEAIKYYANILTPFSALVKKKIEQIRSMNLPIDMIAPSHGVIWRKDPMQIIDKYYEWSSGYNDGTALIIYDTMWNGTKMMAEAIAQGFANKNVKFKIFNTAVTDKSDLITEIFKASAVVAGCPTVNNVLLSSMAAILNEIKGLKFKNKVGGAFGCYGWSGESPAIINNILKEAGFKVEVEPVKFRYRPTKDELEQCVKFGETLAEKLNQ